jgi:hypothetical protein
MLGKIAARLMARAARMPIARKYPRTDPGEVRSHCRSSGAPLRAGLAWRRSAGRRPARHEARDKPAAVGERNICADVRGCGALHRWP